MARRQTEVAMIGLPSGIKEITQHRDGAQRRFDGLQRTLQGQLVKSRQSNTLSDGSCLCSRPRTGARRV